MSTTYIYQIKSLLFKYWVGILKGRDIISESIFLLSQYSHPYILTTFIKKKRNRLENLVCIKYDIVMLAIII